MTQKVLFELAQGVATITLNAPEKRNAVSPEMISALVDLIDQCERSDEVKVVLITGAGSAFCSGGDSGSFGDKSGRAPYTMRTDMVDGMQRVIRKLAAAEKPLIAAINGPAYGAGLDLALVCDMRFAAAGAKLAETYAKLALVPGAGGAWLLPRAIGAARALEMFWGGEPVTAERAEQIGLVNKVVPDADLLDVATAFARQVANGPAIANRLIKSLVHRGLKTDLDTSLEMVAAAMALVRSSADHREAIEAIRDKRPPVFKGQ